MRIKKIKISELKLDERNARKHDERNIQAILDSLKEFGQQKPIVIDENNSVIAGNGTVIASKQLGWRCRQPCSRVSNLG